MMLVIIELLYFRMFMFLHRKLRKDQFSFPIYYVNTKCQLENRTKAVINSMTKANKLSYLYLPQTRRQRSAASH